MKSQEMRVVGSKDQLAPLKALYGHCVYAALYAFICELFSRVSLCMQESFEELTVCVFINHGILLIWLLMLLLLAESEC